mgnify:CR=1 FL=1
MSIIPIENSQAGRVADIHTLLPKSKLVITGEYFHKVSHHLLGCSGSSLESIKTAESHLHALAQCKGFLVKNKKLIKKEINVVTRFKEIYVINGDISSKEIIVTKDVASLAEGQDILISK